MPVLFRQAKDVLVDRKAEAKDRQLEILVAMIAGKWLCCQLRRMARAESFVSVCGFEAHPSRSCLRREKTLSVQTSLLLVSLDPGC